MKKNINSIIISVILAFALFGCNSSINNPGKDKKQNTNTTTNTPATNNPDNPEIELESSEIPLTLQAITAGKIILCGKRCFEKISIQKGDGLIIDYADIITVQPGDIIHFYGSGCKNTSENNLTIECTADCYVYGNVMSLLYYFDFADKTEIKEDYAFQKLFLNNTHIKNHETLDLVLPATKISEYCYKKMFYGCTGLTRAPELPAATLTTECYNYMFSNCTKLNYIKCLATDITAQDCTKAWLYNVASSGSFVSVQDNSIWRAKDKFSGIPKDWSATPPFAVIDARQIPLTLEAVVDGSVTIYPEKYKSFQYTKNGGDRIAVTGGIYVNAGDKLCFYAEGPTDNENYNYPYVINCNTDFYVYGNVMSLLYPDDFSDKTEITKAKSFSFLFNNYEANPHLKNNSIELVLPATTLYDSCYLMMFGNCTGLTSAPVLPATNLATKCYEDMFKNCTSLIDAPELPASSLCEYCYSGMFSGCTSLTNAPELNATQLAEWCYSNMFSGCTGLVSAPELPALTLTNAIGCYAGMFSCCSNLINAPVLSATALADNCYKSMFSGCPSLTNAPELPATTLADSCYKEMFAGCLGLTNAPELKAASLVSSCYEKMFEGCSNLAYVKCLAKENISNATCLNFINDVPNSGRFVISSYNGVDQAWKNVTNGYPSGWLVLSTDKLPFTLEAIDRGKIIITYPSKFTNLQYSKNYGSLKPWPGESEEHIAELEFEVGDIVMFFAEGKTDYNATTNLMHIDCDSDFYIYGNIMSLVWADDFMESTNNYTGKQATFKGLFENNVHIRNHPQKKLELTAKSISAYCCDSMFKGCKGLTVAPELSATTIANYCYQSMFENCTGLTETPKLDATTLYQYCYASMFKNCTGLIEASNLPASKTTYCCYESMFAGCTSLKESPEISATTFPNAASYCCANMFKGCTSLQSSPELKSSTLTAHCYESMFDGCTNLTYVKCLATNISATSCTKDWLNGVAANGTFTKKSSMTSWTTGSTSGIPTGWNVQDATN